MERRGPPSALRVFRSRTQRPARQAEKAANNPSAARTPVFEGAKWQAGGNGKTAPTITWSFATPASGGANAFSAFIGSGYKSTVEQAIAAWAKASGLNFKEVPDSAAADIRIGWGDFDTAKNGVLGFTDLKERNGTFTPGTIIRLEDPSQTTLIKGADGLTYAGTSATLYQVALHEIGHALGLADDSDTSSVMFASSSQANRTLDATDVNGIDALYGLTGGVAPTSALERGSDEKAQSLDALTSSPPGSTAAGIHRLVQAMAAFEPRESTAFLAQVATENAAPPKLATPSHR